MGKWLAEPTLTWREPSWIRRRRSDLAIQALVWRPWILLGVLMGVAHWAAASLRPDVPSMPEEIGKAFASGIFYALLPYGVLKLGSFTPVDISVTDHGIREGTRWTLRKDIDRCELDVKDVDGHHSAWLTILRKKGEPRSFGIPEHVSLRQVEDALRAQGFAVERHPSARHY